MRRVLLITFLSLTTVAGARAQQTTCVRGEERQGERNVRHRGQDMRLLAGTDSLDARLDSLRLAMGRVTGSRKIYAIARLLDALVVQTLEMHREMRDQMKLSPEMGGMVRDGSDSTMPNCAPGEGGTDPPAHEPPA